MAKKQNDDATGERQKQQRDAFSNYENAVAFISTLESWVHFRWGANGKVRKGLLHSFNRFPDENDLTPDFEICFNTPYVIWGDHKRTIQPSATGRDDAVQQILRYARHKPSWLASGGATKPPAKSKITPNFDVLVVVSADNDDVAAEAIHAERKKLAGKSDSPKVKSRVKVAPIVVLGCFKDRESINGEWYRLKWRRQNNRRFSSPNISADKKVDDLNKLFVDSTRHAIPIKEAALALVARNPFINDTPPPLYTAVRLLAQGINELLTEDERDLLTTTGRVEKHITKDALLSTDVVTAQHPHPKGLSSWVEAALEYLVVELKWATKVLKTNPVQYRVVVDSVLLNADLKEWFSERAARKTASESRKKGRGPRFKGDQSSQFELFT